ncbi:MAG: LPS export ABC transporter periplasmic protein LptC [Leptolyngbyaceae bacterium]|nr:LPS export ABC transporter periplasmic protein LptC [Leptolyngbyaceae bacterium]
MNTRLGLRFLCIVGLMLSVFVTGVGCDRRSRSDADDRGASEEPDRNLSFNNITLEQSDEEGSLIWRMVAEKAVYSQDEQTAVIENPSGEFFQDGKATLAIEAEQGEVRNDGEQIFLTGNVVATDVETGAIVRGDELEWRTGDEVIIVRNNIVGVHPDFTIAANRARVSIAEQRVEVIGNVAVVSADEDLQVQGAEIVWLLEEDLLVSDRPIQFRQLNGEEITARAEGERAEFNLDTEVALLENNGRVALKDPQLRVTGDSLQWNMVDNTVVASEPLRVVYRQANDQTVTLQANQGNGDLNTQTFSMRGDVVVNAQPNNSRLNANQLVWNVDSDDFVAEGNVRYQQSDPEANLRGDRAEGKLSGGTSVETIVVTGNQVITEFTPEPSN